MGRMNGKLNNYPQILEFIFHIKSTGENNQSHILKVVRKLAF